MNTTATVNYKNPYRIRLSALADEWGFDDVYEFLDAQANETVVPACCSEGCSVEPDGRCEHGCRSCLLVAGVI